MDYRYIEQLLERYWQGETTLQEEDILRTFFSQEGIPDNLRRYQPLFVRRQEATLGDDFDARILDMIGEAEHHHGTARKEARLARVTTRLMPLFKAAAIVAIILTLGNAAQAPWNYGWENPKDEYAKFHPQQTDDSVKLLAPVQADNISDSTLVPVAKDATNHIE